MAEYLQNRIKVLDGQGTEQLYILLKAILQDIDVLRQTLNTHVHGGITAGAANSTASTTQLTTSNVAPAASSTTNLNVSA